ncbi:MAG: FtsX-like permease family protein [Acidimicrobiia bacterium]|nr:FtsX-like permease family protein [Acidimicrobiia bacterium]
MAACSSEEPSRRPQRLLCRLNPPGCKRPHQGTTRSRVKYFWLIYKNVWRNRRRTLLTITSIAVSLFLVTTLLTLLNELENPVETPASALRLITRHKVSLFNSLPISYRQKIANVEGVEALMGSMWFGGVYKDPSNFFAQFAADTEQFFEVNADMILPADQKEAFLKDRTGCLVGRSLAKRFGWNIGDKIHLKGALFQFDPELTVRAIYDGGSDLGTTLFFHWEYFNEGLNNAGFTGTYTIRARSAEEVPRIAERVDALFQNAPVPTKTETERAFILGFMSLLGNVQFLITSICSAVIFAIVLVAANTMAMSIRERVREIGVLKTLGFHSDRLLVLLVSESLLLALCGTWLGSLGARALYSHLDMATLTSGFILRLNVNPRILLICTGIGFGVGLLAAGVPAWRASRSPAVEALRRVA